MADDNFEEENLINVGECFLELTEILGFSALLEDPGSVENLSIFNILDSEVIEETMSIRNPISNDEVPVSSIFTGDQIKSHLTSIERELLEKCKNDTAFHGRNGQIKWDQVKAKFDEMADNVNVFHGSKKWLNSSSKSLIEIAKKRLTLSDSGNPTPILSSEIAEEPRLSLSSFAARVITSTMPPVDSNNVAQVDNITIVSSTCTRTKRNDHLDILERTFVQDFGKDCIKHNTNVDSDKLAFSYHKQFPSYRRDAQTLKNCWINYRKTGAHKRILDK